jgi:hypothetical protein
LWRGRDWQTSPCLIFIKIEAENIFSLPAWYTNS